MEGGFRACIYAAEAPAGRSSTLTIFFGVDIPSFFRISASSGEIFVR